MIDERIFGLHINLDNVTDSYDQSAITFGGYDESRIRQGHELVWMDTIDDLSWELPLHSISFNNDNILTNKTTGSRALPNPGFPFIAAPLEEF